MESNKLLKVSGILMIIGGAVGILISILAIGTVAATAAIAVAAGVEFNASLLTISLIVAIVGSVMQLIAGILGAANSAKPEKASSCIVFGILVVIVSIASTGLSLVAGGEFNAMSTGIGLVLPALYLIGAFQLKGKA